MGRRIEVLVAEGEGRKDGATHRLSGRARDHRLVHFTPGDADVQPGDIVELDVTYAAPHHLVCDDLPVSVRRPRTRRAAACEPTPVGLGMPGVGRPALTAVPVGTC